MIQRIQSIYLLLIAGLMLAMLFVPFANVEVLGMNGIYYGIEGVIFALSLLTIFRYKYRKQQLNLCKVIAVLLLLFYVILGVGIWLFIRNDEGLSLNLEYTVVFPLIAIVLNLLAARAIKKDEMLVRSADRLR